MNSQTKLLVKACMLILVQLGTSNQVFAQQNSDSLMSDCYNRALEQYFFEWKPYIRQKKIHRILVRTDLDPQALLPKIGPHKMTYFSPSISEYSMLHWPYRLNKNRNIYNISYEFTGPDTITIHIYGSTIEKVRWRHLYIAVWCSGGGRYVPAARFILDENSGEWVSQTQDQIYEQELPIGILE